MKPSRFVAFGRVASTFYVSSVSLLVGLFVAIAAACVSPMVEQVFARYSVLSVLLVAALTLCLPFFLASLLFGFLGRCPSCGQPFVQFSFLPDQRKPTNLQSLVRCARTAAGLECRCLACSTDALKRPILPTSE
ncbi:hypothetical protein [Methylibium petroleiphilum]|uniref:Transmembrane protein n=1 Tax=Methylibium petroleiphilum (strain ATCC BAA-1232 / LMG 22953 / PM1) TaxID=420662 RepID=A2SN75_METPP|nr:hypothetical protein [Methylibium petroleiphilum]ABM97014.1 hypothetical protein Mpe_B0239 [Methylibium petroleiphilum PM1]